MTQASRYDHTKEILYTGGVALKFSVFLQRLSIKPSSSYSVTLSIVRENNLVLGLVLELPPLIVAMLRNFYF